MKRDNTRRITTSIVTAVGLFAGADSYVHIYGLARDWHGNVVSAALAPLTADGLVFASTAAMFAAARKDKPIPARARVWFWLGTSATVLGNGASGWHYGPGTALLNLWPVVAYIGCMEVLTWMLQHVFAQPKKTASSPAPRPAAPVAPVPASSAASNAAGPETAPHDELSDLRDRKGAYAPRRTLEELLADAKEQFPDVRTGGKLPGIRAIQTTVGAGPGKAKQVRDGLQAWRASLGMRRSPAGSGIGGWLGGEACRGPLLVKVSRDRKHDKTSRPARPAAGRSCSCEA